MAPRDGDRRQRARSLDDDDDDANDDDGRPSSIRTTIASLFRNLSSPWFRQSKPPRDKGVRFSALGDRRCGLGQDGKERLLTAVALTLAWPRDKCQQPCERGDARHHEA